jgi:hypothetical protein
VDVLGKSLLELGDIASRPEQQAFRSIAHFFLIPGGKLAAGVLGFFTPDK